MKRGGSLHPARADWWAPTKRPWTTPGGLIAASVRNVSRWGVLPPGLAHIRSLWRSPRGSPEFLAYPIPKVRQQLGAGTWVPRCLGSARSALSPRAAPALGCSLTPGLRISFGGLTCVGQAASAPELWTLGFLLLCGACVWVWVSR